MQVFAQCRWKAYKTDRLSIAQVKLKGFISSQIPQTLKGGRSIRDSQPAFNLVTLYDLREPIIVHKLKKFVITYKIGRGAQKVAVTTKIWDIYLLYLKRGQCDPGNRENNFHLGIPLRGKQVVIKTYLQRRKPVLLLYINKTHGGMKTFRIIYTFHSKPGH